MARCAPIPVSSPAAARRTSSRFAMPPPRRCGGPAISRSPRSSSRRCMQDFLKHAEGMTLFAQDLYGGADPSFQIKTRVFTELAWHSLFIRTLLIRPRGFGARRFRARAHHHRHPELPRRSQTSRLQVRERCRDRFRPQDRPDRRVLLCRRDEEERVHHAELLSARQGRDADALFGQCRARGRCRDLLRPVRHRQDHAVGRSEPHADRRRRARLGQ